MYKARSVKFKTFRYGHPVTQRLRYFLEGFIDVKNGCNFSMTPYPAVGQTFYGVDNIAMKRRNWSRGYWFGLKTEKMKARS